MLYITLDINEKFNENCFVVNMESDNESFGLSNDAETEEGIIDLLTALSPPNELECKCIGNYVKLKIMEMNGDYFQVYQCTGCMHKIYFPINIKVILGDSCYDKTKQKDSCELYDMPDCNKSFAKSLLKQIVDFVIENGYLLG